jgi:hypothetical protein
MIIETQYAHGDFVQHVTEPEGSPGVILAFMMEGHNHSYQVQWNKTSSALWHLEGELIPHTTRPPIQFPLHNS